MRYALSELANDIPEKAEGAENLFAEKRRKRDRMYVLSNRLRSYGAACAAYPYVLKMIGQILKKDYYILPSSVHEVVIVPYSDEFDLCELDEMVKEINDTQLDEEDVLSDHAYFVDHRSGKVFADLDGEKRRNTLFSPDRPECVCSSVDRAMPSGGMCGGSTPLRRLK